MLNVHFRGRIKINLLITTHSLLVTDHELLKCISDYQNFLEYLKISLDSDESE